MEENQLRHFGKLLKDHLDEAMPGFRGTFCNLKARESFGEPMDEVDLASARCEHDLMLQFQRRNHRAIEEIHSALKRIEKGIYGICLECGREIGLERLKVQPMTSVCVECKKELERV